MTHQRFTIAGSTLSLLNVGEQGIVTRIASLDETVVETLKSMGVVPGVLLTLAQRSPRCVIQVGHHQFALSPQTAQAIYLRLHHAPAAKAVDQFNQFAIAVFKRFTSGKAVKAQAISSSAIGR